MDILAPSWPALWDPEGGGGRGGRWWRYDRIGLRMGQHSVSLPGLTSDLFHTFHHTPCLPGSSLVCGRGDRKVDLGASMFKTGATRIASSVARRL